MFYCIMAAPPGYGPKENYLVAAYASPDPASKLYNLAMKDGSPFATTLDLARQTLPDNATKVRIAPKFQFLECWKE